MPNYQDTEPLGMETAESPIGLEVIAFGSPQGFENSASIGYITGNKRDMKLENFIYKQIYQVDAQIDKGSSGGPLVDVNTGKVIGINSLLYTTDTSTNFAFSIPFIVCLINLMDGLLNHFLQMRFGLLRMFMKVVNNLLLKQNPPTKQTPY